MVCTLDGLFRLKEHFDSLKRLIPVFLTPKMLVPELIRGRAGRLAIPVALGVKRSENL